MARGPRRKLIWVTSSATSGAIAAAGNYSLDLIAGMRVAGASVLGATVVRTHLQVTALNGAAAGNSFFWLGLKAADQVEITAGITLSASAYEDWALLTACYTTFSGSAVDTSSCHPFDLRSKRKVQEMSETWGLFITNQTTVAQTYSVYARTLLALP